MASKPYVNAPIPTEKMPGGIPYIIGNEFAERFSFYGMKAILTIFMTKYLVDAAGNDAFMNDEQAKGWYHIFVSATYFTPLLGGLLADMFFGKYKTILWLSLFYCAGHLALALDETRVGLTIGLTLIAIGAGGIKPCVSAHVGDQFGSKNQHLLQKVFHWFYFAINFGSATSMLATPWLLEHVGPWLAFGIPGVLMLLATIMFWMGRHKFVHIPPSGSEFVKETLSPEGLRAIAKLIPLYLFVAAFWALFDQTGSAWVLQADDMDRNFLGMDLLPSQLQAANPFMVMALIPLFTFFVYPFVGKFIKVTAMRRIAVGLFLTVPAFAVPAVVQGWIDGGQSPSVWWHILAYVILTSAEVLVSITALEFSYTQAPRKMKSFIMALFYMSVSLGNLFTAAVNFVIQNDDGSSKLAGASYYWFFTGAMLLAACLFLPLVFIYKEKAYIQKDALADE